MRLLNVSTPKFPNTFAQVDDEDFNKVKTGVKWSVCSRPNKTGIYVARHIRKNNKYVEQKLHRVIIDCSKKEVVTFKDRNALNCCKENLIVLKNYVGVGQGQHKTKNKKTSIYKGVCWSKEKKRWIATTSIKCKHVFIGYFDSEEAAALAYDKKAKELFGIFALCNFGAERGL